MLFFINAWSYVTNFIVNWTRECSWVLHIKLYFEDSPKQSPHLVKVEQTRYGECLVYDGDVTTKAEAANNDTWLFYHVLNLLKVHSQELLWAQIDCHIWNRMIFIPAYFYNSKSRVRCSWKQAIIRTIAKSKF